MTQPVNVALIFNSQTPYRLAFHCRISRELLDIRMHSIFTHEVSNAKWTITNPPEINAIVFGPGEIAANQSKPQYALREFKKAGRIIKWLRENQVKAVVLGGYNDPGLLRIIRWCRKNNVPCLLFGDSNIRDDHVTGWKRAVKNKLVRWVARTVHAFLPCGSLGRAYFERYGAPSDRIFYMPYEPDYALVQGIAPDDIRMVQEKYHLDPSRRRIVFSGRLIPIKRPELLLKAFIDIASDRRDWDLVLVGSGTLLESLKASVPETLRSRVIFTGFLDNQQIISTIYRASDVLVLPSLKEPWALVINEAAAAGLAIVCSDVVGAAAELVRDGINGWTFPTHDNGKILTQKLLDVTDPARIDLYKSESINVLKKWRETGDPVDGLRNALRALKVI